MVTGIAAVISAYTGNGCDAFDGCSNTQNGDDDDGEWTDFY